MSQMAINTAIVRWARERIDLPLPLLAKKMGTKPNNIYAWESGEKQPTFRQLRLLAKYLFIPLGYFFLKEPPQVAPLLPDFRTLPENQRGKFGIDLQEVIEDTLRKRDWYREWRVQQGAESLPFIGKFSVHDNTVKIAEDIRQVLQIAEFPLKNTKSWSHHLSNLTSGIENIGILVFQRGVVGSNNTRPLNVDEFRGFAIADPYAPIIVINSKDSTAARIFTLAHELAHALLHLSQDHQAAFFDDTQHFVSEAYNPQEKEANDLAKNVLIPLTAWAQEKEQLINSNRSENIRVFAESLRIAPAIVAGRVRWETGDYSKFSSLLGHKEIREQFGAYA